MTMGKVHFVGAGPGDPGLITVKGMELVKGADVLIYAGSLVSPELVEMSRAGLKLNSWGMDLEGIGDAIERAVGQGLNVVRLHSGDPSIYGAVVEQMADLRRRGIEVEVVPGVSSMFAAAATLQTQLTLKGVAETLVITRPAGRTLKEDSIARFSQEGTTMVIFLGTEHLQEVMAKGSYPPDTPVAVVHRASWPDQQVIRGTVADIVQKVKDAGIGRTALIIMGGVVGPLSAYRRSELYS
jgi:precorrin-4/cobalt-precorrin-4 C11-methyltransferase